MLMRNFLIIRNKWVLLFILTFGCYITDSTATAEIESQLKKNKDEINYINNAIDSISSKNLGESSDLGQFNKKLLVLQQHINRNTAHIASLKDSLKVYESSGLSASSSNQDIINSLIRIQSKLNIIEDKIFYSDSLYFNMLNDLVIIESQIHDLNKNIDDFADLNTSIEDTYNEQGIKDTSNSIGKNILSYKSSYDLAIELYYKKEYEQSLNYFQALVQGNNKEKLSDNSQFWIGQIYYIQQKYDLAIYEYEKVSKLGDGNKAPDADYKIALSYINLGKDDLALKHFKYIIDEYPNNIDLVNKATKFIEGNK